MKSIFTGISKNSMKNIIYIILLIIAFMPVSLLMNTYFIGQGIVSGFDVLRESYGDNWNLLSQHSWLFNIRVIILSNMTSLVAMVIMQIILSITILPFLQYLFSLSRGYEIGVMRALGLGKGKAWLRLLAENIILTSTALALSLGLTIIFYKSFAFSLLGIDNETKQILDARLDTENMYGLNSEALFYAFSTAIAVTLVSSALCNVLISNSAPLKLIQKHK
ncbi:MAG: hypothetical protein FWC09_06030 [Lachnospiraceae bacterium]|nr:hypothetical protein [Lachnospiraceae bacterium]